MVIRIQSNCIHLNIRGKNVVTVENKSAKTVSVLIPTFNRAHLLKYTLDSLCKQSCKDFEVILIVKPSGDGTEHLIKTYNKKLDIKIVFQNQGYVTDALNLGFDHKTGSITAFLDDDAIACQKWIAQIIKCYHQGNLGGVAGDVIPVKVVNGTFNIVGKSEVIPQEQTKLLASKLWSKPVNGLEKYMLYLTKAGVVESNVDAINEHNTCPSLLGMGANMSVLSETINQFRFPRGSWITGMSWEQYLGCFIWKKKYKLQFSTHPDLKVFHINHDETLSRGVGNLSTQTLRHLEYSLLYYRLHPFQGISRFYRTLWVLTQIIMYCKDRSFRHLSLIKAVLVSEVLGIKWLITKKFGGKYQPIKDMSCWAD